jgi:aryl-alcohol dehydrogenase-like predicted oxidoreductase
LVAEVEALAASKGITPAQLALAWILAKAPHTFAIPGTRKNHRLDENAAAAGIDLSAAEIVQLDAVIPFGAAAGLRYPEYAMQTLNL